MFTISHRNQVRSRRAHSVDSQRPAAQSRAKSSNTTRSQSAPPLQQPGLPKTAALPQRAPTPAALPWGGKFVQFGHTLSQYSVRVQMFFEGLVGLSSPNLDASRHDAALQEMALRLFEIRVLGGQAKEHAQKPQAQDIEAAKACLQQHRQARHYGSRINDGVVGAVAWCKSWFVQPSV